MTSVFISGVGPSTPFLFGGLTLCVLQCVVW